MFFLLKSKMSGPISPWGTTPASPEDAPDLNTVVDSVLGHVLGPILGSKPVFC